MDAGYFGPATLTACTKRSIESYIATGRDPHHLSWQQRFAPLPDPPSDDASPQVKMAYKLKTAVGKAIYRARKCTVEPVIGIIKEVDLTRFWREPKRGSSSKEMKREISSTYIHYTIEVLKRWQDGEQNGTHLWEEITAQGYPGSQRMVYRFLKTLKKTEVKSPREMPQVVHYTSTAAVCLFMQHPDNLEEGERIDLAALRQVHPDLEAAYGLTWDFLQMLRKREGERLDTWLASVHESNLPELESFAHGVEQDKAAVQAGLTLPINNGQTKGHVTRIKLIKRMMYGKAGFALLRQRVLHRI